MNGKSLELLKPLLPIPIAGSDISATDIPASGGNLNRQMGFTSGYNTVVEKSDFNGALKTITSDIAYGNAGGFYGFDATFAESIGGYPKNAVLAFMYGGTLHLVRSMHDNNLVNFNTVGVNDIDWKLVLPNDTMIDQLTPDINWNARNAVLLYSVNSSTPGYEASSGRFNAKGYVVVVDNNVVFKNHSGKFYVTMIVSSINGQDLTNITPSNIFANPLSQSVRAFPVELISGYYYNIPFVILNQFQVQKDTEYKIYVEPSDYMSEFFSSGSYDIYFLPTPD